MTEEEIRIGIAEHLGWTDITRKNRHEYGGLVGIDQKDGLCKIIPSFYRDLNAMHEAEMSLPVEGCNGQGFDGSRSEFRGQLRMICEQPYHAKARERAEAFLRTVGKWKEEA
jgi:hypothetical protein